MNVVFLNLKFTAEPVENEEEDAENQDEEDKYDAYLYGGDDLQNYNNDYKKKVDDKEFKIQIFGINEKRETFCLYLTGFLPFIYVRVPDNWNNEKVNL